LASEIPVYSQLLSNKYDGRILGRLAQLMRSRQIDVVITVGAGDKMFWGRLAAWRTGVPVVLSALHSTGWPDGVGRLNRLLTPLTDAFIAVAGEHGRYLVEQERFPPGKVRVVPNGVDVERFQPRAEVRAAVRQRLGLPPHVPVCGIVAALREEKNHLLFLRAAALTKQTLSNARFLIVGDGPLREKLQQAARDEGIADSVHFLGSRADVAELLPALDLFALTSHNEANPVSILEAMAAGLPVVATRVGSVAETVKHGVNGYLAQPGNAAEISRYWLAVLSEPGAVGDMGRAGRQRVVQNWSLQRMVDGYQQLIAEVYQRKCTTSAIARRGSHVENEVPCFKTPC
jgi:glycosyltransferase involved in cell wall biosynthesis